MGIICIREEKHDNKRTKNRDENFEELMRKRGFIFWGDPWPTIITRPDSLPNRQNIRGVTIIATMFTNSFDTKIHSC